MTALRSTLLCLTVGAGIGAGMPAAMADGPYYGGSVKDIAAPYSWTGFYIGGHVGGVWGNIEYSDAAAGATHIPPGGISTDPDGFIGGGQIGFNYQTGRWVFGIEGDFSWSNADGSVTFFPVATPTTVTTSTEVNWLATVTGRIGYAWDRWLIYAKGGAAWMDADLTSRGTVIPGGSVSVGDTHSGWTVGAGVEWALAAGWSTKLEYNFMDFGTDTLVSLPIVNPTNADQQVHAVKFGINYKF
jgi:outer membrane immunogenic protein